MDETKQDEMPDRPVRADARRNLDGLLKAALEVFKTSGVNAPVREIASKAGVGVGTLYRHFPNRSDLIVAVFHQEVDACAEAAPELAAQYPPSEALARWMQRLVNFVSTKRGLSAALHTGDPAYEPLPIYFDRRLRPALQNLLDTAEKAGEIRPGADATEQLRAVSRLASAGPDHGSDNARRMVALLVDGLRYRASPSYEAPTSTP